MAVTAVPKLCDLPTAARVLGVSEGRLRRLLAARPDLDVRVPRLAERRVFDQELIEQLKEAIATR